MRIGILTTAVKEEERRLIEVGKERGHKVEVLEVLKCSIGVCPDQPTLYFGKKDISQDFDIIIPRIDVAYSDYGLAILRQFQALEVYTTDTAYSIELGRDKLRCMQYLMRRGVPFPTTGYASSKEDFDQIIGTVGGAPLVIKLIEGTEGIGVFLAENEKYAKNLLKTFSQLDARLLVQKFIEESSGTDIRCFVVGDEVVASMRRESQDGDFRANVALGGHAFTVDLTPEEEKIAIKATQAIGLNIAGVDVIRSNDGPLIIEINVAPDFTGTWGLEAVSGVNVANHIIAYAEKGKKAFNKGKGLWLEKQPSFIASLFK